MFTGLTIVDTRAVGSVRVTEDVTVQFCASLAVTVYAVPAFKPVTDAVNCAGTVFHE